MPIDVPSLLARTDLVSVVTSYGVKLRQRGQEYIGLCVAHDDHDPSMSVVPLKGFVHCHVCGFHEDAIGFVSHMDGVDFKTACDRLGANDFQPQPERVAAEKPLEPAKRICSAPPAGNEPDMAMRGLGAPVAVWAYLDAAGAVLYYVARYEVEGKKTIRPWTWGTPSANLPPEWRSAHWTGSARPLYGLDRLAKKTATTKVALVEGEKAADAGQTLLPGMCVMTWAGGSQSYRQADWTPLAGCHVILIPDADIPGMEAMRGIAGYLLALGCTVQLVDSTGQPDGWDLADALAEGWSSQRVINWAREHMQSVTAPGAPVAQDIVAPESPAEAQTRAMFDAPPLELVQSLETQSDQRAAPRRVRLEPGAPVGNVTPVHAVEFDPFLPPEFSEAALAEAWSESAGADWRYTHGWGKWAKWDGARWLVDEKRAVTHACKVKMIEAANWTSAQNLTSQGRRALCSNKTISNVLQLAGSDPRHAMGVQEWDADVWLLGTPAGVVDLRTGEMRPPARADYITKLTACAPALDSSEEDCPTWIGILARATGGSDEMLAYIQRWCGYMLTGDTREEGFLFVYGPGGSGKSTFVRAVAEIAGDYARASQMDAFAARERSEHATEIANLAGARIVTATETEEGARWNESRIKALTGRDKISTRFMRQDFFEFMPQFKILIAGNFKPTLRSVGEEMRRRIHLLNFPESIPEHQRIRDLPEKLRAEYPAILAWMVRGALLWREQGLGKPEAVKSATEAYLTAEDTLGAWLDECCERGSEDYRTRSSDAYASYHAYIEAAGEGAVSQKRFVQRLEARGLGRIKSSGVMYVVGLRLKPKDDPGKDSWHQEF